MFQRLTRTVLSASLFLATTVAGATASQASESNGPSLQTPAAVLNDALRCAGDLRTSEQVPVLLVPGTFETSEQAYSWGYERVLRASGHPVCTVSLPDYGVGDMQLTVEYVVNAVRVMNENSGGKKISIIGHSQGGLLAGWAVRYWPDLSNRVEDIISLDSPYGGTATGNVICGIGYCPVLAWQVRRGSNWSKAMRSAPVPTEVSYTSIGSRFTDLITPSPDATYLPGATQVIVQDICPGRYVGHLDMLSDAVAHAVVIDALGHVGPAKPGRIPRSTCLSKDFPGMDRVGRAQLLLLVHGLTAGLLSGNNVASEPPLRPYASTAIPSPSRTM